MVLAHISPRTEIHIVNTSHIIDTIFSDAQLISIRLGTIEKRLSSIIASSMLYSSVGFYVNKKVESYIFDHTENRERLISDLENQIRFLSGFVPEELKPDPWKMVEGHRLEVTLGTKPVELRPELDKEVAARIQTLRNRKNEKLAEKYDAVNFAEVEKSLARLMTETPDSDEFNEAFIIKLIETALNKAADFSIDTQARSELVNYDIEATKSAILKVRKSQQKAELDAAALLIQGFEKTLLKCLDQVEHQQSQPFDAGIGDMH